MASSTGGNANGGASAFALGTSYGKQAVPVFKVRKQAGGQHSVVDLSLQIMLEGQFEDSWLRGENHQILPTETQKNTCYALALQTDFNHPVVYGLSLAHSILSRHPHINVVDLNIEERPWERLIVGGQPHHHCFSKPRDPHKMTVSLRVPRSGRPEISCGVKDLCLMKTTQSGFSGFIQDEYTNLQPVGAGSSNPDRIMCTELEAFWNYTFASDAEMRAHDFGQSAASVLTTLLESWAGPAPSGIFSKSVQETAYRMGTEVLRMHNSVDTITIITPNIHHYRWDAEQFGLSNANVVFQSTDCHTTASGRIQTVISRAPRSRL